MPWVVWLALWALGIPGDRGCLQCDPGSMRLLRELTGTYLKQQLRGDPELRERLEALLQRSLKGLAELPIGTHTFMGVIDEKTMGEVAAHFRRAVTRIMENDFKDGQLFNEVMWSLQALKEAFTNLMAQFQREGRMVHQFIDCWACKTELFSCNRNLSCGRGGRLGAGHGHGPRGLPHKEGGESERLGALSLRDAERQGLGLLRAALPGDSDPPAGEQHPPACATPAGAPDAAPPAEQPQPPGGARRLDRLGHHRQQRRAGPAARRGLRLGLSPPAADARGGQRQPGGAGEDVTAPPAQRSFLSPPRQWEQLPLPATFK
ncbi:uncharacterized protein LOC112543922 isoform X4 [Pelodiscus sinensis]|uniref:uncharacterized protein LOC112543922 isoform X4 n=1 Tax=Pelodiscus sinensis TaxID=13735 RepID=UPI003F6A8B66